MLKWVGSVVRSVRQTTSEKSEEELVPMYTAFRYAPIHIDDILHDRYKVVGKLGYGQYSTVWMAQDSKQARFVFPSPIEARLLKTFQ